MEGVSQRRVRAGRGRRDRDVLHAVSFEVATAEVVAVWGRRRSGRSTLLRVAAGIELPDEGAVRFGGVDLRARSMLGLPDGIGYCTTTFTRAIGDSVLDHVAAPLLGGSSSVPGAEAHALAALRRVGAVACASLDPLELDHAEVTRVAIARALVTDPRLLLVDEPTAGASPARDRDAILALLRSLADRDGIAVLMTASEATDLAGADRALTLDGGELRGQTVAATATVVPLRRADARG